MGEERVYNVLIVGCGGIGALYLSESGKYSMNHIAAIRKQEFLTIKWLIDADLQSAVNASRKCSNAIASNDLDLLSSCEADIAVIAGPTRYRKEHLEKVYSNSSAKLVVCEKPLSEEVSDLDALSKLLERKDKSLIVNYTRSWDKGISDIVQRIRNGEFGEVESVYARYSKGLMNTGSHLLATLDEIFDKIEVGNAFRKRNGYRYSLLLDERIICEILEVDDHGYQVLDISFLTSDGEIVFRGGGQKIYFYKKIASEWAGFNTLDDPVLLKDSYHRHLEVMYEEIAVNARYGKIGLMDNKEKALRVERLMRIIKQVAG